ncbi:MAG: N-acetyltransferase [Bacteroidales bacterium]|nr:N-acetyltransferase [Bacteroidales bacterium]
MSDFNKSAQVGEGTIVEPGAIVGFRYHPQSGCAVIGRFGIIRIGTIIYADVNFGDYLQTGHYVVIRAKVNGGDYCAIGNQSTLEGYIELGTGVRIMSHVYIPSRTVIGNHVFIGPGTNFLNDKTPCRYGSPDATLPVPKGAVIEDDVVIGGGCTINPGIRIGKGSFIASGTLVTKDIPPDSLAKGSPVRFEQIPDALRGENNRKLTMNKFDIWHPALHYDGPK